MTLTKHLQTAGILARSLVGLERPDRIPRALAASARWGPTTAGLIASAAARHPDRAAVIDEDGAIDYRSLWRQVRSVAAVLTADGIGDGSVVGVMMRNHRGFPLALGAVAATGADLVLLNTGFARPQLADVVEAEGITAVIHDDEFAQIATGAATRCIGEDDLDRMAARHADAQPEPRRTAGRTIILTSGTTGRPKGAERPSDPSGLDGVAALLDRIPLRPGDVQVVPAPMFHAWGLSHLLLGLSRCATTVVRRRFDPAETMTLVTDTQATVIVVVPVMLARIMALPVADRPANGRLRVIASSGSAISGALVTEVLDHFGPVLYNLYGSTEVAVATIATPGDLHTEPTTAGRPVRWVEVDIVDDAGAALADGQRGRIFVGGSLGFSGYTNGDDKERIRGLLSTGDVGSFRNGLLFVDGRDDDMIVSGGENVYPREVEELLVTHPDIDDAVVVGVPDDEFGQALAAYVVPVSGAAVDRESVRALVKDQLARHKVPRHVVTVDALPRNQAGKIVRRELPPL